MLHKLFHKHDQPDSPVLGIICGAVAFLMFAIMNASAKYISDDMNPIGIGLYRNIIGAFIIGAVLVASGKINHLHTKRPYAHAARAFLGVAGLIVTFTAFWLLPMAQTTVILFSTALILPVLSILILKEHVGIYRWGAIIIGFVGVVFAAQPDSNAPLVGIMFAFGAATIHAFGGIALRWLGKTEDAISTTFYFMFTGSLIILPFAFLIDMTVPAEQIWLIFVVGISGTAAQLFLAGAFKYAEATLITPLNYTGLIWATIFDLTLWGLVPTWPVLIGGFVVIGCNLFILHREHKLANFR